jgi:hypothetical protein
MNIWTNEVGGTWEEKAEDSFEQVGTDELFKLVRVISKALDDSRHTK